MGAVISSNSIEWDFSPADINDRNGEIQNYTLFYTNISSSGESLSMESELSKSLTRSSDNQGDNFTMTIDGLEAGCEYNFTFQACNEHCTSEINLGTKTTLDSGKIWIALLVVCLGMQGTLCVLVRREFLDKCLEAKCR